MHFVVCVHKMTFDHRSRLSQVHILMEYLALNINLVAFPADMYIYMTYKLEEERPESKAMLAQNWEFITNVNYFECRSLK